MKKIFRLSTMLLILIILTGTIFIFFKSFKLIPLTEYATEIMAAFLGATFTTVITAVLLSSQSAAEEQKEKNLGIFQNKLTLFNNFIDFILKIKEDGIIDSQEKYELKRWGAKFAFLCSQDLMQDIQKFIYCISHYEVFTYDKLTNENKMDFREFLKRTEYLDDEDMAGEDDLEAMFISIGQIILSMSKELGNTTFMDRWLKGDMLDEIISYKE